MNRDLLDSYKGFAFCAMLGLHTLFWLHVGGVYTSIPQESYGLIFPESWLVNYTSIFGWLVLSFVLTAGISFRYWLIRFKDSPSFSSVLFRVAIFMLIGLYIGYHNWYIFQFLAVSILFSYLIIRFSSFKIFYFLMLGSFFCMDIIRNLIEINLTASFFKMVLIGTHSSQFFWPFFPWIFLFSLGMFLAELKIKIDKRGPIALKNYWSQMLMIIGMAFYNFSAYVNGIIVRPDIENFWGRDLFQPHLTRFLGFLAPMLFFWGFLDFIYSRSSWKFLVTWVRPLGSQTLIVFIIHYCFVWKYIIRYAHKTPFTFFTLTLLQIITFLLMALGINKLLFFYKTYYFQKLRKANE